VKQLLIISPYFPPVNAADMQRIRMSLPYFLENEWNAEVVMVDEHCTDLPTDPLLLQRIPATVKLHKVKVLNKQWTSKLGLGSIALRSIWFYKLEVNKLLKSKKYDLIYFSTTQFPVCVLGAYWKKRFGVPYVIDMQDPWHSEYYQDKPKAQRPPKYWFSYRLNKHLEPIALKNVNGLISVSDAYIADIKKRYAQIKNIPAATITFGAFDDDLKIANDNAANFKPLLKKDFKNIVYIGRGGTDMHKALIPLFKAFKEGLASNTAFDGLKFYFIGTSYATAGSAVPTILPLAKQYGIESHVTEITGRISYYHTLATLQQADALFLPGSDDPKYTASKIFPYLSTPKPLVAIFNKASSAITILKQFGVKHVYDYDHIEKVNIIEFFEEVLSGTIRKEKYNPAAIEKYSARNMALQQCRLFDEVLKLNASIPAR
jgi:hypothetical protein